MIAGGQLSGFLQTAFRAELAAVLAAILFAAKHSTPCWVYSDCQGVVDRVQGFLNGFPRPGTRGRNSDLWTRIFDAVLEARQWLRGIVKVKAHQDVAMARSPEEAWLWENNHHADRAADAMNQARSPQFWQLWDRVRKGWVLESQRAKVVFDLHKTIALRAVFDQTPRRAPAIRLDTTGVPVLSCPVVSNEELMDVSGTFGFQFCQVLANWIRLRCHGNRGGVPRWMSLLQLLVLFMRDTGLRPPVYHVRRKRWLQPGTHVEAAFVEVDSGRRLQWWRRTLRDILVAHKACFRIEETRPFSSALLVRLPAILVDWSESLFHEADAIIVERMGGTCAGHSRLWARTNFI